LPMRTGVGKEQACTEAACGGASVQGGGRTGWAAEYAYGVAAARGRWPHGSAWARARSRREARSPYPTLKMGPTNIPKMGSSGRVDHDASANSPRSQLIWVGEERASPPVRRHVLPLLRRAPTILYPLQVRHHVCLDLVNTVVCPLITSNPRSSGTPPMKDRGQKEMMRGTHTSACVEGES